MNDDLRTGPGGAMRGVEEGADPKALVYGANHDLERLVTTHLFCTVPNYCGSTFLKNVLSTCRATWNLWHESHRMLIVQRAPRRPGVGNLAPLWAADRRCIEFVSDPHWYDWRLVRKAWYFQAWARQPNASVFVAKSPRHVLHADLLAKHFRGAKFLFSVRNPYAHAEGVCRAYRRLYPRESEARIRWRGGRSVEALAAAHVVNCLLLQRRNIRAWGDRGVFFTYEAMCAEPGRVARDIRALAPELDDLDLLQRVPVKGRYNDLPTDMNARQIARLTPRQLRAFNRVFEANREVLEGFGYELMDRP